MVIINIFYEKDLLGTILTFLVLGFGGSIIVLFLLGSVWNSIHYIYTISFISLPSFLTASVKFYSIESFGAGVDRLLVSGH